MSTNLGWNTSALNDMSAFVSARVAGMKADGKSAEEMKKTFESEGLSSTNLNGFVGIQVGNTTVYHPEL